ncbi:MAG: GntR family transcriptional regulator [Anaerolineales bacterium]
MTLPALPDPPKEKAAESLFRHFLYLIATGKWSEGTRIPSIRKAEKLFGVSRTTVQMAYQLLVNQGLVESKPKSGYVVKKQLANAWIARHRDKLRSLYDEFSEAIGGSTGLATLPVMRYLTKLAEIIDHERPSCAFIECTLLQAEQHVQEIGDRLAVQVVPMTVNRALDLSTEWPSYIKSAITTHFHHAELVSLRSSRSLELTAIPIEVSPDIRECVAEAEGPVILLETERQMARDIAFDAQQITRHVPIETITVDDVEKSLSRVLGEGSSGAAHETTVLLSPRDWGKLNNEWRTHPNVRVITFRICESAWNIVAEFLGMPIGPLG